MTRSPLPPLGSCQLCRTKRHLSPHKSKRDGLVRNLCTHCFSDATLAEERGGCIDWSQAHSHALDEDLLRWLRGDL